MPERQTVTCPRCGMTSANPMDVLEGYCGACHDWTSPARRNRDTIERVRRIHGDAVVEAIRRVLDEDR